MPSPQELTGLVPGMARDLLNTVVFARNGPEAGLQSRPRFVSYLIHPRINFFEALRQDLNTQEVFQLAHTARDHTDTGDQFSITVRDTDGTTASVQWSGDNREKFVRGLKYRLGGYERKVNLPYYKDRPAELEKAKEETIRLALETLGYVSFPSGALIKDIVRSAELAAKQSAPTTKTITI